MEVTQQKRCDYGYGLSSEFRCSAFGNTLDIKAKWVRMKAKHMMSQTKYYEFWEQLVKDPKIYEVRYRFLLLMLLFVSIHHSPTAYYSLFLQQELKYLRFLVEEGQIKPKIAEQVTIEEVPDAQRYIW